MGGAARSRTCPRTDSRLRVTARERVLATRSYLLAPPATSCCHSLARPCRGCLRVSRCSVCSVAAMKVAVLQLGPVHGQPERNMRRADELLAPYSKDDNISVLVLPELAFTGYLFRVSHAPASPGTGRFCLTLAFAASGPAGGPGISGGRSLWTYPQMVCASGERSSLHY
eukprot:scaffold3476_cov415-Prasinococcus_capsulatus_cf.AAC.1